MSKQEGRAVRWLGEAFFEDREIAPSRLHHGSGRGQDPLAAMIGPLRCVPDISPWLGALPKVNTLPSASETQYPPLSEVAKMADAGLRAPVAPGGTLPKPPLASP